MNWNDSFLHTSCSCAIKILNQVHTDGILDLWNLLLFTAYWAIACNQYRISNHKDCLLAVSCKRICCKIFFFKMSSKCDITFSCCFACLPTISQLTCYTFIKTSTTRTSKTSKVSDDNLYFHFVRKYRLIWLKVDVSRLISFLSTNHK